MVLIEKTKFHFVIPFLFAILHKITIQKTAVMKSNLPQLIGKLTLLAALIVLTSQCELPENNPETETPTPSKWLLNDTLYACLTLNIQHDIYDLDIDKNGVTDVRFYANNQPSTSGSNEDCIIEPLNGFEIAFTYEITTQWEIGENDFYNSIPDTLTIPTLYTENQNVISTGDFTDQAIEIVKEMNPPYWSEYSDPIILDNWLNKTGYIVFRNSTNNSAPLLGWIKISVKEFYYIILHQFYYEEGVTELTIEDKV